MRLESLREKRNIAETGLSLPQLFVETGQRNGFEGRKSISELPQESRLRACEDL